MKLLTLNTYSWVDTEDAATYAALITDILENQYDAIALQEVNQLSSDRQSAIRKATWSPRPKFPSRKITSLISW